MTQEEWLAKFTFRCPDIHANVTPEQCEANRGRVGGWDSAGQAPKKIETCLKCTEYEERIKTVAASRPKEAVEMTKRGTCDACDRGPLSLYGGLCGECAKHKKGGNLILEGDEWVWLILVPEYAKPVEPAEEEYHKPAEEAPLHTCMGCGREVKKKSTADLCASCYRYLNDGRLQKNDDGTYTWLCKLPKIVVDSIRAQYVEVVETQEQKIKGAVAKGFAEKVDKEIMGDQGGENQPTEDVPQEDEFKWLARHIGGEQNAILWTTRPSFIPEYKWSIPQGAGETRIVDGPDWLIPGQLWGWYDLEAAYSAKEAAMRGLKLWNESWWWLAEDNSESDDSWPSFVDRAAQGDKPLLVSYMPKGADAAKKPVVIDGIPMERHRKSNVAPDVPFVTVRVSERSGEIRLSSMAMALFPEAGTEYVDVFKAKENGILALRLLPEKTDCNSVKLRRGQGKGCRISAMSIIKEFGVEPGRYPVKPSEQIAGVLIVDFKEQAA